MAKTATIKRRDNAPDFVVGSFGFKLDDLSDYMNTKGYINFDILKSKEGGQYVKINDYGIDKQEPQPNDQIMDFGETVLPF